MSHEPRLTTVMGVARAVLGTTRPDDASRALVDEFGWDLTFHALALLRGDAARTAFGLTWSMLVLDQLEIEATTPVHPSQLGPHPGSPRP